MIKVSLAQPAQARPELFNATATFTVFGTGRSLRRAPRPGEVAPSPAGQRAVRATVIPSRRDDDLPRRR